MSNFYTKHMSNLCKMPDFGYEDDCNGVGAPQRYQLLFLLLLLRLLLPYAPMDGRIRGTATCQEKQTPRLSLRNTSRLLNARLCKTRFVILALISFSNNSHTYTQCTCIQYAPLRLSRRKSMPGNIHQAKKPATMKYPD